MDVEALITSGGRFYTLFHSNFFQWTLSAVISALKFYIIVVVGHNISSMRMYARIKRNKTIKSRIFLISMKL